MARGLRLLLRKLAEAAQEILRVTTERKTESTFHTIKHREGWAAEGAAMPTGLSHKVGAWRSGQA